MGPYHEKKTAAQVSQFTKKKQQLHPFITYFILMEHLIIFYIYQTPCRVKVFLPEKHDFLVLASYYVIFILVLF